jgi:hypothetical protein
LFSDLQVGVMDWMIFVRKSLGEVTISRRAGIVGTSAVCAPYVFISVDNANER